MQSQNGKFPEPRAVYVHVPFCAHRCPYCDFTLVAGRDDLVGSYLDALEREMSPLGSPRDVDTIFFGGGTPTHLSPAQLDRLFSIVLRWFRLADGYEFTVEANPAGLSKDKVDVLADYGVNRVSLGVQSFDQKVLSLLERDHRREGVIRALERLRPRFANISLDLIFGVPGQTLDLWRDTLQQAAEFSPQHISTYGLTFEKGTSFWRRREKGQLVEASEELERDMYAVAMDELSEAGFEQYEISNFAQPGFRCRHNEVYWKGLPYYAFGPGAARYIDGRRETNHRSVLTWLNRVLAGESPVGESEQISEEERARELLILGLRRCEGICRKDFRNRTGYDVDQLAGDMIVRHCLYGLLEDDNQHVRFTREGRFLADYVIVDLM